MSRQGAAGMGLIAAAVAVWLLAVLIGCVLIGRGIHRADLEHEAREPFDLDA